MHGHGTMASLQSNQQIFFGNLFTHCQTNPTYKFWQIISPHFADLFCEVQIRCKITTRRCGEVTNLQADTARFYFTQISQNISYLMVMLKQFPLLV